MKLFNLPKQHNKGWFIGVQQDDGDYYLHSDGVIRLSTYNREAGKYMGFFPTETTALYAILKYYEDNVADYTIIETIA